MKQTRKILDGIRASCPPKPEGNLCQCCGKNPAMMKPQKKMCLDHEHGSNKFRGWLCENCNLAIGLLGDTLDGVMNAVRYLSGTNKTKNDLDIFGDESDG